MAITFDTTQGSHTGSASSLSWSHTVATGRGNQILIVVVDTGAASVSSVTYGGQNLSQVSGASASNSGDLLQIWYLLSPPTGANTVVVTPGSTSYLNGISASYSGVAQTSTFGTAATNSGNGTTSSTNTVATTKSSQLVIEAIDNSIPASDTATASQTKRLQPAGGGTAMGEIAATGSNMTLTWSFGASAGIWVQISVAMNAAVGGVTPDGGYGGIFQ